MLLRLLVMLPLLAALFGKAPRRLTGMGTDLSRKAAFDRAVEMLAKLGINWINGASPRMIEKLHLIDETNAYHVSDGDALAIGGNEADARAKAGNVAESLDIAIV